MIGSTVESDKETLLSGKHAALLRDTLEDRGVLVFPKINLSDSEQVEFTRTLGNIIDEGKDNVYKITMDTKENANADYLKGAFYWHIDGTVLDVPIFASLLSGRVLAKEGGQTDFCNTYAAFEHLPIDKKELLASLHVVHSFENSMLYVYPEPSLKQLADWQKHQPKTLPLVWSHRSGRKSLVLGSTASYIMNMPIEEGRRILVELRDWATQPQFSYRHEWSVGDLVIWDNTGTMHRATPYTANSGRMMHRTKLAGEEPIT